MSLLCIIGVILIKLIYIHTMSIKFPGRLNIHFIIHLPDGLYLIQFYQRTFGQLD